MSDVKIRLSGRQIDFLTKMLEIKDSQEAVKKFSQIMTEERISPKEMSKVIDIILERMTKK